MKGSNKFFLLLIYVGLFFSCRTTKDVYSDRVEIKNISDSRLIKSVEGNYLHFRNLYVKKFNAEVTVNGSRKAFSGSLFLERDSHLIMTVAPLLGIELFRAKMENDSVYLIDRTKKHIYSGSYDFVEKSVYLDVNFKVLQAIIANEFFVINDNGDLGALKRFKHYVSDDVYLFNSVKLNRNNRIGRTTNVIQNFEILPGVYKIRRSYIQDIDNQTAMSVQYSELIKVGEVWFPSRIHIQGNKGNQKFEASISFNSIDMDSSNKLGFSMPRNYKQVIVK